MATDSILMDNINIPIKWITDCSDVNEFLNKQPYAECWGVSEEWMRNIYSIATNETADKPKGKNK